MKLARRIGELLPGSTIGWGDVPDGGKGFAQGTRFVPNIMYNLSLLPKSDIPHRQEAAAGPGP